MFSWIAICGFASFLELWRLDLLTWNTIVAFSEQFEAKVVHVVLLLYLAVSSVLER